MLKGKMTMTTFEFMTGAFYIMAGTVCAAVTVMVVLGVIAGIRRGLRKNKKDEDHNDGLCH